MSAALQNFLCFLIKAIFPVEELGELVYLFWFVSKLSQSVPCYCLECPSPHGLPASLGDAVVLAAGCELRTSPDDKRPPNFPAETIALC